MKTTVMFVVDDHEQDLAISDRDLGLVMTFIRQTARYLGLAFDGEGIVVRLVVDEERDGPSSFLKLTAYQCDLVNALLSLEKYAETFQVTRKIGDSVGPIRIEVGNGMILVDGHNSDIPSIAARIADGIGLTSKP